jgi:hypothetical protein
MGRGSLGVRWSAARLLLTKRELSRFADGLRSKVREAHADESDASRRRENRPDQVECDFTYAKSAKRGTDYFPPDRQLAFAAGCVPGGSFKREGRASDRACLSSINSELPGGRNCSCMFGGTVLCRGRTLRYNHLHNDQLGVVARGE